MIATVAAKVIANSERRTMRPFIGAVPFSNSRMPNRKRLSESGRGGGGSGRRRCSGRWIAKGVGRAGPAWEPEEWQERGPASSVRRRTDRRPAALVPG